MLSSQPETVDRRYWGLFALISVSGVLEFFDLFVVGFVVAAIGTQWQLTFATSALMLLSGGVGSIIGALVCGRLADTWGRRPTFIATSLICGVGSLSLATIPEGSWAFFCVCRAVIGFGVGGAASLQVPYITEFTPLRLRRILPGGLVAISSVGIFAASSSTAILIGEFGWRGMALIGALPIALAGIAWIFAPESVGWLLSKGRRDEAERVATLFPSARSLLDAPAPAVINPTRSTGLSKDRITVIVIVWLGAATAYNGIYLWGPIVLALALPGGIQQAAGYFAVISLTGVSGKLLFAVAPQFVTRRSLAILGGAGGAVALAIAAFSQGYMIGPYPAILFALMLAALFVEGEFANLAPYTNEMVPVQAAGRAMGLAQAANGIGKIIGPLALAMVAGLDDRLTPKATADAVTPGFLLLAAFNALVVLAFLFVRIEPRTHD